MKDIVIDLKQVGRIGLFTLLGCLVVIGFTALIGLSSCGWWYWPESVVKVETVRNGAGELIRMECRGRPGFMARLFGYVEEENVAYYRYPGAAVWRDDYNERFEKQLDALYMEGFVPSVGNEITMKEETEEPEVPGSLVDAAWELEQALNAVGVDCRVFVRRVPGNPPYFFVQYYASEQLDLLAGRFAQTWKEGMVLYSWCGEKILDPR